MNIEQQFFEAFGIEQSFTYFVQDYDDFNTLIDEFEIKNVNRETLIDWFSSTYHDMKVIKVEKHYPQITPEIVLNLIKILLDCDIDILIAKDENGYIARKNIMSYSMHWVVDENFNNTVLKLCIQLKDEIQEEVKAVFNEG